GLGLNTRNQVRQMRAVGRVGSREFDRQRMAQRVHGTMDFAAIPTAATTQRLGFLTTGAIAFFFAPAAATLARMHELSTLSHSVSSSRSSAAIFSQTPRSHQRL